MPFSYFIFNLPTPLHMILLTHSYADHLHCICKRFICSSVVRVFSIFSPLWIILIHVCIFLEATSVIHRREFILIKPALAFTLMYFCKHVCIVCFITFFLTFICMPLKWGKMGEKSRISWKKQRKKLFYLTWTAWFDKPSLCSQGVED